MTKEDKKLLAIWAVECSERVLPFFESYSNDDRPRKAIETCKEWIKTGIFSMKVIRKASLDSHKAASEVKENDKACFAAHAAGQAVATCHVKEHAFGPAYYGLNIAALDNEDRVIEEFKWQSEHLPEHLRKEWAEWNNKRLPKNLKKYWIKFLNR